jgi:hypothetical protein
VDFLPQFLGLIQPKLNSSKVPKTTKKEWGGINDIILEMSLEVYL